MGFHPPCSGYFGKLPARGDFVRAGLPESFVAPLDLWCRELQAAGRAALGEAWLPAWMVAPVWQFRLPPGACGPQAALGVWMPSQDRAGRQYPFILAALDASLAALAQGGAWLQAAEEAGLAAVVDDALEALAVPPAQPPGPLPAPGWWTQGAPGFAPCHLALPTLFPPASAGAMLASHPKPEMPPT